MKCTVTFRHMQPSDLIRTFAEERVDRLTRLIDRGVEAQVTLTKENHLHRAHVELVTDGSLLLRGIEKSEDLRASIDAAVDHIMRQVKRYRAKIKSHRAPSHAGRELPLRVLAREVEPDTVDVPDVEKAAKIVKQETIIARSLSVEDALMQLDLANTEFLVFTNSDTHQVNVVYRLPDGQFGLIEAHAAA
ncbi:MAG: ribosome-associated translation inhibitor RaiA [Myxococcota bacterium]